MGNPFVTITTVSQGVIAYWWTRDYLHDMDYQIKVGNAIREKVKSLKEKYAIEDDTDYRTQFEGVRIYGEDRVQVEQAASEIARYLNRFKGVRPLS